MGILDIIYIVHLKFTDMPNPKSDSQGFSTSNADQERDLGAKGGPTTSVGRADDQHAVARPYDHDMQTQIVAKGKSKDKKKDRV